jgi:hypothetical protein
LLLTTGAVGANNHLALLDALLGSPQRPQIIVLCRPQSVWQEVATWATLHPELPVRPVAFTDRMAELLQCVSAVVARPGTGTTSEALLERVPDSCSTAWAGSCRRNASPSSMPPAMGLGAWCGARRTCRHGWNPG